jgi:hypothetical protein
MGNPKAEHEILEAERRLGQAMADRNLDLLRDIFDDDYVCTGSDGSVWGKAEAMADFAHPDFEVKSTGDGESRGAGASGKRIVAHDTVGIVRGSSSFQGRIGDKVITGAYQFTRVWSKDRGPWKVIAVHISKASASE